MEGSVRVVVRVVVRDGMHSRPTTAPALCSLQASPCIVAHTPSFEILDLLSAPKEHPPCLFCMLVVQTVWSSSSTTVRAPRWAPIKVKGPHFNQLFIHIS